MEHPRPGWLRQHLENPEHRREFAQELLNDPNLNSELITLALKARGYNNYQNGLISGEIFFIQKVIAKLDVKTCLDVGAAQGGYAALLLRELRDCRVHGVEPLPQNHPALEDMARRMPERFHVLACALGAKAEERWLAFNPEIPQHATLCEHLEAIEYLDNKERVAVAVKTLDQIWLESGPPERLDFIKIDSEGWECDILDGAHETIRRTQPKAIQLEFNRHHLIRGQTLLSIARRLENYMLFQLLPNRIEPRDPTSTLANIFQFSNFAFIHKNQLEQIKHVIAGCEQPL